tara:strand:- start:973 stop:2325 length:1353 start_codon:yes stop_codon:yes gene_type:complete
MNKSISKSKLVLALISLIITFFVWQQGLKDSLNRPSVTFDINLKESEIAELARPAIPENLKKLLITDDPLMDMRNNLSKFEFKELSERNKLIWLTLKNEKDFTEDYFQLFTNKRYVEAASILRQYYSNNSYKPNSDFLNNFKDDQYIYHILKNKFNLYPKESSELNYSNKMFIKLFIIKLFPIITILLGTVLVLKGSFQILFSKKINWQFYEPLELNLLDMVLLISGGFVVLGEVFSPLISITLVDLFSKNLASEINQSLKIFFGYLFMSIPPLLIIYYQIKSIKKEFIINEDYLQFNFKPFLKTFIYGFKGWLMIIPFVLLISLLMNYFSINKAGSNPLLEIVLNNNNYLAFILLFVTTTLLAPFFEEIIFRGVLLPILSRDFGIIFGIIISSFIFALAHLSLSEFPPLFVLGIGLGVTRLLSGRLGSSIFMHSLWNGLTFFNLFLLRT